jgi:hypothetical protein
VPVLIAEDLGPIDAVKRSARLIRETWGTSLRTTLRFGVLQMPAVLAPLALVAIGVAAMARGSGSSGSSVIVAVGGLLVLIGVVAFIALAMVFSAVSTYARALIYRYATGRDVPGVDPLLFAGAFRQRRGRRGIA